MTIYTVALDDGTCGAVITPKNQKVKILDTVTVGLADENGMFIEKTGQVLEILEVDHETN